MTRNKKKNPEPHDDDDPTTTNFDREPEKIYVIHPYSHEVYEIVKGINNATKKEMTVQEFAEVIQLINEGRLFRIVNRHQNAKSGRIIEDTEYWVPPEMKEEFSNTLRNYQRAHGIPATSKEYHRDPKTGKLTWEWAHEEDKEAMGGR